MSFTNRFCFSLLFSLVFTVNTYAESVSDNEFNSETTSSSTYVPAEFLAEHLDPKKLFLRSSAAIVMDQRDGVVLFERDSNEKRPIASLTKLMTAMVILDSKLPMNEILKIKRADRDRLRGSKSRLSYGTQLTREDMLLIALAASENRAAAALARTFPGGKKAFVAAMNIKADALGLKNTHFTDSTGLHSGNISTASELAKIVDAAYSYPLIRDMTTSGKDYVIDHRSGWKVEFFNTNRLVRRKSWDINLSKTGYIADAGYCMVMHTNINERPVIIVLLNSWGKYSKFGDSNRIRHWIDSAEKRAKRSYAGLASAQS